MTALRFLAHLPAALARDVWHFLTYDPACRFANLTNEDD